MAEQPKPRVGDTVLYHAGTIDTDAGEDTFAIAALVTMTTDEWQPGYRGADGTWVATSDVEQPKPGTVHLRAFWPTHKTTTPPPLDVAHVPYGKAHGCWTERA